MNLKGLIVFILIATPWTFVITGTIYLYKKYKSN